MVPERQKNITYKKISRLSKAKSWGRAEIVIQPAPFSKW
jgi:hypothetical protein